MHTTTRRFAVITIVIGLVLIGAGAILATMRFAPLQDTTPQPVALTVASPAEQPAAEAPAPTVTEEGSPTRLVIDAIGVDEPLAGVGLTPDGAMDVPDFGNAAWYDLGPEPGEAGAAVVVAHVSSPAGPDVFARLAELSPGDRVLIHRTDGVVSFVVTHTEQAPKDDLPYDRIWNDSDVPLLRLITCGGLWDAETGHFLDNVIVYAELG